MTNSREKGKRGEREVAQLFRDAGIDARRGVQYSGGEDSPDVVTEWGWLHVEAKYQERMRLYEWMDQAVNDGTGKVPVVVHRCTRKPWLVTMRWDDWIRLAKGRSDADV